MTHHSIKQASVFTTGLLLASFSSFIFMVATPGAQANETVDRILSESLDAMAMDVGIEIDSQIIEVGSKKVKVAVFDNGFRGFEAARGVTLPASTKLRTTPITTAAESKEAHGLKMAEIVAGLLSRTEIRYELHLFPTFGYNNLKSAIETVVK
ncbi:MAG: hypothetical protein RBT63_02230, partial [Bdellovibrionales bacterium]|nr:hypothetical protein [Bdellovibrionales bacterium]